MAASNWLGPRLRRALQVAAVENPDWRGRSVLVDHGVQNGDSDDRSRQRWSRSSLRPPKSRETKAQGAGSAHALVADHEIAPPRLDRRLLIRGISLIGAARKVGPVLRAPHRISIRRNTAKGGVKEVIDDLAVCWTTP